MADAPPAKRQKLSAPTAADLKALTEKLTAVLEDLTRADEHHVFTQPVEGVEGYADVVKQPMDFQTMRTQLADGKYRTHDDFEADVCLTFTNCLTFNPPGTFWHNEAIRLHKDFCNRIYPKHGLQADIYVEYQRATDDETTFDAQEALEAEEYGGVNAMRTARKQEVATLRSDAKKGLTDLLAEFGDPAAILAASKELAHTQRANKRPAGADGGNGHDAASGSDAGSSDEEQEESEEEGEESSDAAGEE